MCGIAGVFEAQGRRASRELLLDMAGELAHRGPDGVGLYLEDGFGMVNTRLSIVDLAGGDQPIGNEDGRYWVMQNGEIYDAPELRDELTALGHVFETRCDTEVIVHAYEEWGEACLDRFNGPFAFAVWDRVEGTLFLARDRYGIRPLFIAEIAGTFLFASEMKAILRHPAASRELDPAALVETLTLWASAPDRATFRGIRELPPGTWMRIRPAVRHGPVTWWVPPFAVAQEAASGSADALAEELLVLLEDATRLRLRADVPVGAYVSGGLDSSLTAALAARVSGKPLSAFALTFRDPRYDERSYQRRMADELGVELVSIEVDGPDVARELPEVVRLTERPLLRTAPAPLLALSRAVHGAGLKVVLTGEGADEVFAGYAIFREDRLRRLWARHPNQDRPADLLLSLYPYLVRDLKRARHFASAFFAKHRDEVSHPLYSHLSRFDTTGRLTQLLSADVRAAAEAAGDPLDRLMDRLPADFMLRTPLARAQHLEIITFLEGYLLHSQGDRMLMGNAVEGRFPFLDHRLAAFAARLPDRMRLFGLREKYLLQQAARRVIPAEIASRKKKPYRAPILGALVGPGRPDYLETVLGDDALRDAGVFDVPAVRRLVQKCERNASTGVGEVDEMGLVAVVSTMLIHFGLAHGAAQARRATPNKVVEKGSLSHA